MLGERDALRRVDFTFAVACRRAGRADTAGSGAPRACRISGSRSSSSRPPRARARATSAAAPKIRRAAPLPCHALPLRPTLRDVTPVVEAELPRPVRAARTAAQGCRDELSGGLAAARAAAEAEAAKTLAKGLQNCEEELRRTPALSRRDAADALNAALSSCRRPSCARAMGTRVDGAAARWRRLFGRHLPAADRRAAARSSRRFTKLDARTRGRPADRSDGAHAARRGRSTIWTARMRLWRADALPPDLDPAPRRSRRAWGRPSGWPPAATRGGGADRVLVVARAVRGDEELLRRLRSGELAADGGRGTSRSSTLTAFGCADGSIDFAAFAEKAECARTRGFWASFGDSTRQGAHRPCDARTR